MRINVTNTTAMPIYVGSAMIPPGETRDFEESDVPLHLRPKRAAPAPQPQAEPSEADKMAAFVDQLVAQPVGEIREHFAVLSDDYLAALEAREQAAEKPRKGLLEAIAAEKLQRAEKAAGGGQG